MVRRRIGTRSSKSSEATDWRFHTCKPTNASPNRTLSSEAVRLVGHYCATLAALLLCTYCWPLRPLPTCGEVSGVVARLGTLARILQDVPVPMRLYSAAMTRVRGLHGCTRRRRFAVISAPVCFSLIAPPACISSDLGPQSCSIDSMTWTAIRADDGAVSHIGRYGRPAKGTISRTRRTVRHIICHQSHLVESSTNCRRRLYVDVDAKLVRGHRVARPDCIAAVSARISMRCVLWLEYSHFHLLLIGSSQSLLPAASFSQQSTQQSRITQRCVGPDPRCWCHAVHCIAYHRHTRMIRPLWDTRWRRAGDLPERSLSFVHVVKQWPQA